SRRTLDDLPPRTSLIGALRESSERREPSSRYRLTVTAAHDDAHDMAVHVELASAHDVRIGHTQQQTLLSGRFIDAHTERHRTGVVAEQLFVRLWLIEQRLQLGSGQLVTCGHLRGTIALSDWPIDQFPGGHRHHRHSKKKSRVTQNPAGR